MSKVFVVPDIHLKLWMLEEADKIISADRYDKVVMLGDLVDDWGMEYKLDLYDEMLARTADFIVKHNAYFCYGNHDVSYLWDRLESGFSPAAHDRVIAGMRRIEEIVDPDRIAFIHKIDNTLFSHAGLTDVFVNYFFDDPEEYTVDELIEDINEMSAIELWTDASPIWARPQGMYDGFELYPEDLYQVVGHTPVRAPQKEGNLLTLDTFSTYSDGRPIGDQQFVWVDTVTGEWGYC